mgnify:CR=1 FL=1
MKSLNQVSLIGNLGELPEVRKTTSGKAVANFNIALNEQWTDDGGDKQERVTWVSCVAWEGLAEIAGTCRRVRRCLSRGSFSSGSTRIRTR